MTMDKADSVAVMEVERFSKLGTIKLQQGHPQKALEAYKSAYQSAQTLGHHGYMQRACAFNLGAMLISIGSFADGLTYLNQAIPPEGRRDAKSNGDLYFNYGLAYGGQKNPSESKRYFLKALEEYRSEKNNLKMEADTVSRIGKICTLVSQFSEAEAWTKQLIQLYDLLGEKKKKLQAQIDRANLLLKDERVEEAEEIADDCMKGLQYFDSTENTANILIELSLAYTQMCRYEKALESSKRALPLVKGPGADLKYETVLYQNLGAIYNYMQQYEEAIKYHEAAVKKHAELKNRKSQGHCFINMGYAYSQLGEMEKAEECFQHAQLAAKDSEDNKSEWQSLEALGSVVYHQGKLKRAQDYYKKALTVLAKSAQTVDQSVQDRIMAKLTSIIQQQIYKPRPRTADKNVTEKLEKTVVEEVIVPEDAKKISAVAPKLSTLKSNSKTKDGNVIAVRRGTKIKFLRVRRSGTLQQFNKVALGLDPNFSRNSSAEMISSRSLGLDAEMKSDENEENEDLSAYTTEEEDETESNESENKNKTHMRPPDSFIPHHGGIEGRAAIESDLAGEGDEDVEELIESGSHNNGTDDDYDERKQLIAKMEQLAQGTDEMELSQTVKKEVIADVHAHPESHDEDEESTDDSDSYSGSSSEDEEAAKKDINKRGFPPVPSISPHPTAVRTYEEPIKTLHYETIDHKPPVVPSQEGVKRLVKAGEVISLFGRPTNEDGKNYFHSEDENPPIIREMGMPGIKEEKEGEEGEMKEGGTTEGTIYESIRPPTRRGRNTPGEGERSDGEEEDDRNDFENLPKGEKDKIMFHQFQAGQNKYGPREPSPGNQTSSRFCIVM